MKRTLALAAALAATLTLAACGGQDETGPATTSDSSNSAPATPASGDFSDADVMFAQMMVPHHAQAVEMSDMILAKDDVDEGVLAIAQQIKDAQAPEITQMTGWLEGWDAEMPSAEGMGEMDMDEGHGMDMPMNGMMSEQDMQALDEATGDDASRLFLEQMTEHHRGAVQMAETQLAQGTNPEAKELAQTIIDTQEAEIEELEGLLADL